jgi:iron(III) transport system permease protein
VLGQEAARPDEAGARPASGPLWLAAWRVWLTPQRLLFCGLTVVVLGLVLPPLVSLLRTSLHTTTRQGGLGEFTLENYLRLVRGPALLDPLRDTLIFALATAALAVPFGALLAFVVERTEVPLKRAVYFVILFAFSVPSIISTIAWVLLLGNNGPFNRLLMAALGRSEPLFDVYSLAGMALIEAAHWLPLVFLLMSAAFQGMDPALEEAAVASGGNAWVVVRRITAPLVLPTTISVLLLLLVRTAEAFEVPAVVGIPGRVFVLVSRIYTTARSAPPDYGGAAALAVALMVLVAIGLLLYGRVTAAAHRFHTVTGKAYRPRTFRVGAWRLLVVGLALLLLGLPLLFITLVSLLPFYNPSPEVLAKLTLDNYVKVLRYPDIAGSAFNTLLVAAGSATVVVVLTGLAAWLVARSGLPGRQALDYLVSFPVVFPAIILGLAVARLYLELPLPLYDTLWLLLVGFVTRYSVYGMRALHAGMLQLHPELEEAAYASGVSWARTLRRVTLPLLSPAALRAWVFVFILGARELSLAVMLSGPRSKVLSITLFDMWNNSQVTEVAALGTLWGLVLALLGTGFLTAFAGGGRQASFL